MLLLKKIFLYRDFVPKMVRRRSRIRFDENVSKSSFKTFFFEMGVQNLNCNNLQGNSKYDKEGPKFHMGFPREYQVCHKSAGGISDMGAPTYWRLARLSTQMTSEGGTKDTTQEPQV